MKRNPLILLLTGIVMLFSVSCSKDDVGEDLANASHKNVTYTVAVALYRSAGARVYLSEQPFTTYDKFTPLKSLPVGAFKTGTDSVTFNVSEYVGKTLYAITLRKKLLSDGYYSIISTSKTQSPSLLKFTVKEGEPVSHVAMVISEPAAGTYTRDVAKLALTVKKGSTPVANREIYWYGAGNRLSDALIKNIETHYALTKGEVLQKLITKTNASGVANMNITIDERGVYGSGNNAQNFNENVFFVMEGGKVKVINIDMNALTVAKTLSI
ncbi:hypothetical protein HX018_14405 [Sphingobacterium hotanense]|uniref:DUF4397 domain-containing protein n=1 Tax=Sphingobacterium hotanense TaxID=649196 RepID=A0ABT7NQF4_9SPHI|nr:hypothetical protein [Sphingobacterium hotanense]